MELTVLAAIVIASEGENEDAIACKEKDPFRKTLTVDHEALFVLAMPRRVEESSSISTLQKTA